MLQRVPAAAPSAARVLSVVSAALHRLRRHTAGVLWLGHLRLHFVNCLRQLYCSGVYSVLRVGRHHVLPLWLLDECAAELSSGSANVCLGRCVRGLGGRGRGLLLCVLS